MLFLIAKIKRFGTLNATQKNAALYKAPFLKKIKKNCQKLAVLNKNAFLTIFMQFFLIFSKTVLCRGLRFFCVLEKIKKNCQKLAVFNLKKNAFLTIFRQFFLTFSRTVPCRGLRFFCVAFSVPKRLI